MMCTATLIGLESPTHWAGEPHSLGWRAPCLSSKTLLGWRSPRKPSNISMLDNLLCGSQGSTFAAMPGHKRQKTDEVDMEHLVDILQASALRCGLDKAFDFGDYDKMSKQQAVNGRDLANQKDFIADLKGVSDNLLLKYTDLKAAYTRLVRKYPQILARYGIADKDYKPGHFAKATMTLLTHTRRLKDEQKMREACRGLPGYHIAKLNDLRDMVLEEEKNSTLLPLAKAGKPSKSEEQQPKKDSSSWKDILDLQIPATQSASEGEPALASEAEGLDALGESPVPPRKKDLKAKMKNKPSPQKKPAAVLKKPAGVLKPPKSGQSWFLAPYNEKKNWSVAVREKGGKQVVAVTKFHDKQKNWAGAAKLLKMLEAGKSYDEVKEAKDNL